MEGYQHPYMYNTEGSCDRRGSWYSRSPTYHVNAANMALLPNQAPFYRPSVDAFLSLDLHVALGSAI